MDDTNFVAFVTLKEFLDAGDGSWMCDWMRRRLELDIDLIPEEAARRLQGWYRLSGSSALGPFKSEQEALFSPSTGGRDGTRT